MCSLLIVGRAQKGCLGARIAAGGIGLAMKRTPLNIRGLVVVLLALQGCHGVGWRPRSLTATPTPFSLDVPIPAGFRLASRIEENRRGRATTHEYIGWADREALRDFYRLEMPLVRWRELDEPVAKDRYLLLFDRGDKTCRISIRSAGLFSFGRSIVVAQIAQRTDPTDVE